MTKYIAFLRGINVGNIRIKMTDLQSAFEKMNQQKTELRQILREHNNSLYSENKSAKSICEAI